MSEFKNQSYSGSVERLPNCIARFKVKINNDEVKNLKSRASKAINKEVSVPGFRKGKAPDDLILKQYGKHVDQEFREVAIRAAAKEAMDGTKLYPIKQDIGLEVERFHPEEDGVEVTFRYEIFPEVPDVKLDGIKLEPVELKKFDEKELEQTLRQIQLYHGHFHEVKDRPVQEDDFVIVDIDVIDEPPFKAYENSRFQMTERGMPAWARKMVIGHKIGESVEGMSEKEKDSTEEGFVPRKCRITIKDIQTAHLPEVDDELAKKAGVQTVDELKKNIRDQQEKQHGQERQNALRNQVREFLKANYVFDIPATDLKGLEGDCKRMIEQDKDQFKSPEELKAYKEKLFENGKGLLRLAYLIPHVGAQLGLNVPTEQEINNRMIQVITQYYLETGEKVPEEGFEKIRGNIQRELIHERVLDALIEKNLTR